MKYTLSTFLDDLIQITGDVNGVAVRKHDKFRSFYVLQIRFFIGPKLIKIRTSEEDRTMTTIKDVTNRIEYILAREENDAYVKEG